MYLFVKIWGFYFKLNFALRFTALENTVLGNVALRFSALRNRIIAL